MIIAKLDGQLGNQMFAYATAYSASRSRNEKLSVYRFEYDTLYHNLGFQLGTLKIETQSYYLGIPLSLYGCTYKAIFRKLGNKFGCRGRGLSTFSDERIDILDETPNTFTDLIFDETKNVHMIRGFRQSPLYFDTYRADLLRMFVPNYCLESETKKLIDSINKSLYSVSIHIRRGDYVKIGCCVTMNYYEEAMDKIILQHPDSSFFVFSDDILWVKQNLNHQKYDITFIERKKKAKPFSDIWAMSKCKANIIANSSFSWWAAYLNQNPEKIVIAPKKILENNDRIVPSGWIVIDD